MKFIDRFKNHTSRTEQQAKVRDARPNQYLASRRDFMIRSAFSVSSVQMRSLITGLPVPFLLGVSQAAMAAAGDKKFTIISHNQDGDPINVNAPGSYSENASDKLNEATRNGAGENFSVPVSFNLGNASVKAAKPWAQLNENLRSQLGFWHHGTFTNAHPEFPAVRRLNGAARPDGSGIVEFSEILATETHVGLGTLLEEPISLGGSQLTYKGRVLPILQPATLKKLLGGGSGGTAQRLSEVMELRDTFIDEAYANVKQNGTPAQSKFLDAYALSRQNAQQLGSELGDALASITGNTPKDQGLLAAALVKLKVAPVISIGLEFGGDNHADPGLSTEIAETKQSINDINSMWEALGDHQDKTIITTLNTFGRSLIRNQPGGRNHNGAHHTMLTIGSNIKPGVIGGVERDKKDFAAKAINSTTGGTSNTDIKHEDTLTSVAKTLSAAVGIDDEIINQRINGGKIIRGALI